MRTAIRQRITTGDRAKELAARIIARIGDGANSTGNDKRHSYGVGLIGELEFCALLDRHGVPHRHNTDTNKAEQRGDVQVAARDSAGVIRPLWIDVKTGDGPRAKRLMTPVTAWRKETAPVIVGARIIDDICEFWGWGTRTELGKKIDVFKVESCWAWLHELRPMDDLLARLDREPKSAAA